MNAALRRLNRRLNADAYDLLCAELARLEAENESLRSQLSWAEDCAERWREDAIEAINAAADTAGGMPGLTVDGRMVVCLPQQQGAMA